jgi:hypothetical protein
MHPFNSSGRCCASMTWITTNECLIKTVLSSPDGTRSSEETTPALKRWAILRGKGAKRILGRGFTDFCNHFWILSFRNPVSGFQNRQNTC